MSKLSEVNPHLLFLFNLIVILAVSWFASWTYLYSLSGLWRHLSSTDFRNLMCISMLISTLIVVDGMIVIRKSGILRKPGVYLEPGEKQIPTSSSQKPKR